MKLRIILFLVFCLNFHSIVFAEPTGGEIVGGSGAIGYEGLNTTINQTSQNMAISWESFNIDVNENVNFIQPNSSAVALNRILDQNPSQIFGSINANGQVMLINPNGIVFNPGSSVNVGGLLASGLDINPSDFMNGDLLFNAVEGTDGVVINRGLLNAATGGSISLLGQTVENEGLISADLGRVSMASGSKAVVTFESNGLIGIEVTQEVLSNSLGVNSATVNSGTIEADGGQILLTAKVSQDLFDNAVNNSGVVEASSVEVRNGTIILGGTGGDVVNSGTLDVSANNNGVSGGDIYISGNNITHSGIINANAQSGDGGQIEFEATLTTILNQDSTTSARSENDGTGGAVIVQAKQVGVFDNANIDVSGATGGGTANIGGGFQGNDSQIRNAEQTIVASGTTIVADALTNGDGGTVIVWADQDTAFSGYIYARGGSAAGNGGFVEVSGKEGLIYQGQTDTSASFGHIGTLLLDPGTINITTSNTSNTNNGFPDDFDQFINYSAATLNLDNEDLADELRSNDVLLRANVDINVNADVTSAQTNNPLTGSLSLEAGRSITLANDVNILLDEGNFSAIINHQGAVSGQRDNSELAVFTMGAGSSIETDRGDISITSGTYSGNNTGTFTIETLDSSKRVLGGGSDDAGLISVTNRDGDIVINGSIVADGADDSAGDGGFGGSVDIEATSGSITLASAAFISAIGGEGGTNGNDPGGDGGDITLIAGNNILQNGWILANGGQGGNSNSGGDDGGAGGTIILDAGNNLDINNSITSNGGDGGPGSGSDNAGNGGIININVGNDLIVTANLTALRGTPNGGVNGANGQINILGDGSANSFSINNGVVLDSDTTAIVNGIGGNDTLIATGSSNTWTMTGTTGEGQLDNTASVINFSAIENLTGGDQVDQFIIQSGVGVNGLINGGDGGVNDTLDVQGDAVSVQLGPVTTTNGVINVDNVESVSSSGAGNTLVGDNSQNYWTIDSTTGGSVAYVLASPPVDENVTFNGFDTITGGTSVDNFTISADYNGTINGGSQNDVFDITNVINTTLNGGDGSDIFNLQANYQGVIDGEAGNDIINISAAQNGNSQFNGGANDDLFNIDAVVSGTVQVNGDDGGDTFNINADVSGAAQLNGGTGADDFDIANNINVISIDGGTDLVIPEPVDVLNVFDSASNNNWSISTGTDGSVTDTTATPATVNFNNIESIIASENDDTFTLPDGIEFAGTIDAGGGAGTDTLSYANWAGVATVQIGNLNGFEILEGGSNLQDILQGPEAVTTWDITAADAGTVSGIVFSGFENIVGGSYDDTFIVNSGGSLSGTTGIDGGVATNQQNGDTLDASVFSQLSWENLSGLSGIVYDTSINPSPTDLLSRFNNMENLISGAGGDSFSFIEGNPYNGNINAGAGNDVLNYSTFVNPVVVDLGNFTGFESVIGGAASDTLIGANTPNTWNINDANGGTVSSPGPVVISFSSFENLTGGNDIDTFILGVNGSVTGNLSGGTAPSGDYSDVLDASAYGLLEWSNLNNYSGQLNGFSGAGVPPNQLPLLANFTAIENIISGAGNDNFQLADGANFIGAFGGSIAAGLGNDTLDYSLYSATNVVDINLGNFSGFEAVIGGQGLNDSVTGANNSNTWNITSIDAGDVGGISFSGFENLIGGGQDDTFVFNDGVYFNWSINGGAGPDTLDYSAFTATNNLSIDITTLSSIENMIGGASVSDTIIGSGVGDSFNIVTAATGNVNGISFSGFEILDAAGGDDSFVFNDGIMFSGTMLGGIGNDTFDFSSYSTTTPAIVNIATLNSIETLIGGSSNTLDTVLGLSDLANNWTITDTSSGTVNGITFSGFENLTGGSMTDSFVFNNGALFQGNIDGGAGTDTLDYSNFTSQVLVDIALLNNIEDLIGGSSNNDTIVGPDLNTNWNINGFNTGDVAGITFASFEQLNGGALNDNFIFSNNGLVNGQIDGGGGLNTLDYTNYSSAVVVNRQNTSATTGVGGFQNITTAVGSSNNDVLIGLNSNESWIISDINGGNTASSFTFDSFETLTGGNANDIFVLNPGASIAVGINGGLGSDTLDYSSTITPISVNLATQNATAVGQITSIETLIGGQSSADSLTGLDAVNTWTIDNANSGSVGLFSFSAIENISGGALADNFNLLANGSMLGVISGGAGDDVLTVDYSNLPRIVQFDGGNNNLGDTVVLQGSALGQDSQHEFVSASDVINSISNQTVNVSSTERIIDNVIADSLTVIGTTANDTMNLDNNGPNTVSLDINGGTSLEADSKSNLVISGNGGSDTVVLQDDVTMPVSISLDAESIQNPNSSLISGSSLAIANASAVGSNAQPINTAVDSLQLTNISGDVYIQESNNLEILDTDITGNFELRNLAGDINASGMVDISGNLTVTSANNSNVIFANANNNIAGAINFSANAGALGNIQLVNDAGVVIQQIDATDLSITANGSITDSGSIIVSNQASFDAMGNDVILDDTANNFAVLSISNANVATINDQNDLNINDINAQTISLNAGGSITDNNGTAANLVANSIVISAQDGIGDGDALETQTGSLELMNSTSGDVEITNTGNLTLVSADNSNLITGGSIQISTSGSMNQQGTASANASVNLSSGAQYNQQGIITVQDNNASISVSSSGDAIIMSDAASSITNDGDINYSAGTTVYVSTLDAVYGQGAVVITAGSGDILSTRDPNPARPNVTGGSAIFNAELGSLGTFGRPLVVNVPGAVIINTLTSVDPIFLVQPQPLINESRVLFGVSDAKAEVGGSQRTEVDALAIIDPAIFTQVKNYREDDNPIRLPADQLVEEDDEDNFKKKQDPDIFEQQKPYDENENAEL